MNVPARKSAAAFEEPAAAHAAASSAAGADDGSHALITHAEAGRQMFRPQSLGIAQQKLHEAAARVLPARHSLGRAIHVRVSGVHVDHMLPHARTVALPQGASPMSDAAVHRGRVQPRSRRCDGYPLAGSERDGKPR